MFLALVCGQYRKALHNEKEERSFSLLDRVTTVPESVKLMWICKIQGVCEHMECWLLS